MSIAEQVAQLAAVKERIPVELLARFAESEEMPDALTQAFHDFFALREEVVSVLGSGSYGTQIAETLETARTNLLEATQNYQHLQMQVRTARDAAEQSRYLIADAIAHHSQ